MSNGELWCGGCAMNQSHLAVVHADEETPVSASPCARVAVRSRQGVLDESVPEIQRIAHFVAADQPDMVFLGHDSGDSQTIFHCCFCGSGQVIARSDGTVECEFCHSVFTVQVQPQFPAFPQTVDGMPVDVPGMPSNSAPPPGSPLLPGAGPDEDPDAEDAGGDAPPDEADDDGKPAFLKGGALRTSAGAALSVEDYLRHLAITHGPDRARILRRVRERRS
jgi:hypothetical protein